MDDQVNTDVEIMTGDLETTHINQYSTFIDPEAAAFKYIEPKNQTDKEIKGLKSRISVLNNNVTRDVASEKRLKNNDAV